LTLARSPTEALARAAADTGKTRAVLLLALLLTTVYVLFVWLIFSG
jgi:hypothetical protein